MEKMKFLLLLLPLIGLAGCVKQKECDCGYTGVWQYLEEPYFYGVDGSMLNERKIVATITESNYVSSSLIQITGSVPKKYTSLSPIRVNFCVRRIENNGPLDSSNRVWKLLCIEDAD